MSTGWRGQWSELHCYRWLLAVTVWVTPAALHGVEDKVREESVVGSCVYFKETA